MWQQIIALVLILFFIWRLFIQKSNGQIKQNEFIFWLSFWSLGALAIIFIRVIDRLVGELGFAGAGINFLLYLAVISLFYLVFKLRLKIAKIEKQITDITRAIALKK